MTLRPRLGRRLPVEAPAGALTGFKLAQLLLAVDGSAVAFSGCSIGSRRVYRADAEAVCVFSARHAPPHRWCDCGFYAVFTAQAARDMGADPEFRGAVLLEVDVFGRYVRYERGLRYAHQRVRAVRVGLCGCGRRAETTVDWGEGRDGFRRLWPVCEPCAGWRPQVPFTLLADRLGGVPVGTDPDVRPVDELVGARAGDGADVAILNAEVALLQARLDAVQSRLGSGPGAETR